jgi:hypothetical protein
MGSARSSVPAFVLVAADLAVGGLLYYRVSVLLGLLLLVCGLSVLVTVAYEPLSLVGSVLRRRLTDGAGE